MIFLFIGLFDFEGNMVEIRFGKYGFGEIIWKELVLVTSIPTAVRERGLLPLGLTDFSLRSK
jgi:hypothetical protein